MKKIFVVLISFALVSLLVTALFVSAEKTDESGERQYIVSKEGDFYRLSSYDAGAPTELGESSSLNELFGSFDTSCTVIFDSVSADESVSVLGFKNIKLCGKLSFTSDYTLNIESESCTLSDLEISFDKGGIRFKSSKLNIINSNITSRGAPIVQSYRDSSALMLERSTIGAASELPALILERGSANINDCALSSLGEYAVRNNGELKISRSAVLSSLRYAVCTQRAFEIYGEGLMQELVVKYCGEFEKGTLMPMVLGCVQSDREKIKIFDSDSKEWDARFFEKTDFCEEINFVGAFNPHVLKFKYGDGNVLSKEVVSDVIPKEPTAHLREGFTFCGWYLDEQLTERFYFDTPITEDKTLYAQYKLNPPEFSVSSKDFVYDAAIHEFSFDYVSHPLEGSGEFLFEWWRDGEFYSSGESLSLCHVSDSGTYFCKIVFSFGKYTSFAQTPTIQINIKKAEIQVPKIESKEYTGLPQSPMVAPSAYYRVETVNGIGVGLYPTVITLTDSSNYKWATSEQDSIVLYFEITRANNCFVEELSTFDIYFLAENTFKAKSKFGEVKIEYAFTDGTPLDYTPFLPGEYIAFAVVEGSPDYFGIRSEPKVFSILSEQVIGISLLTQPDKTRYVAFDSFVPNGVTVLVSYNSGRSETVGADRLSVSYQSADSFRFSDSAVRLSFGGKSVLVPVTVTKADYVISDIIFSDSSSEYNGLYQTVSYVGALPIGKDGISLCAYVEGGGTDAGSYTVKLTFYTESENYNAPSALYASFTVVKKRVALEWDALSFVYNGKRQAPSAFYIDVFGVKREAQIIGGEYYAGENYTASAVSTQNYDFENASVLFEIKKADYDLSGVVWSGKSFKYDGTRISVSLSGLPTGVEIVGYANNTATLAGEYAARVSLSFDSLNYNEPDIAPHLWTIYPADYDLSSFEFFDTSVTFDGLVHYPRLEGEMPVGLDGSVLEFSFSQGALHVSDGEVKVEIRFAASSSNYNVPESVTRTVKILPAPIFVTWTELSFVYDEKPHVPSAYSPACAINTFGEALNAGEYVATAISVSSDYYVENANVTFVIEKAANRFTEQPCAENIFEGQELKVRAAAYFGKAQIQCFYDKELSKPCEMPLAPGKYFAVATVRESGNYLALSSLPLSFSVIAVVPVGIRVTVIKDELFAFDIIMSEHFIAYTVYNDGSEAVLDSSLLTVGYGSADSLRVSDTDISFYYGDFYTACPVSILPAKHDLSQVRWCNLKQTYDGTEKHASLEGLPSSLKLVGIDGGSGVFAGEYAAYAVFEYDRENYESPSIPNAVLVIERARLSIPCLMGGAYSGKNHPLPESPYWSIVSPPTLINACDYTLRAELSDKENYVFENGTSYAEFTYSISPREISVIVDDVKIYLGKSYANPKYKILGEVIEGDDLGLSYEVVGDRVRIISSNPNYRIKLTEGRIIRSYLPAPEVRTIIFIIFLLVIILLLLIFIFVLKRHRLVFAVSSQRYRRVAENQGRYAEGPSTPDCDSIDSDEEHLRGFLTPMDMERADTLISNSLAKELLNTSEEHVFTSGRQRGVVNVDTLNDNFASGDRVDVNILKEKNLIPYDTGYLKVLARGMIDKPLFVYANDFSLSAVKMLALTGGKAIKVNTVRMKNSERQQQGRDENENSKIN